MVQAFVVYLFLMFYLVTMWSIVRSEVLLERRSKNIIAGSSLVFIITILLYGVMLGLRDNVGGDYQGYVSYYNSLTNDMTSSDVPYEWGFYILIRILRAFDLPSSALFVATCFIQMFFICLWLRQHTFLAPWLIYFFFTCLLVFESMNTIRQALAYSCILTAIPFLFQRKFLRFFLIVIFASAFHFSAIFFVLLYFFLDKIWIISPLKQFFLLLLTYAWANTIKDYLFEFMPLLALGLSYEGYSEVSGLLFFEGEVKGFSVGMLFLLIVDAFIIKSSSVFRLRFHKFGFKIYYNLYMIGALLTPIVLYANYIPFQRFAFYFTAFKPVVLAFLMYGWFNTKEGYRHPTMRLIAFALVVVYLMWFMLAINNKAAWCAPFQFVWQ